MSKGLKRLLLLTLFLAAGWFVLSQLKYVDSWTAYQKNKAVFDTFSAQLEVFLQEMEEEALWHETDDPHLEFSLREGEPISFRVGRWGQDLDLPPSLAEGGQALQEAGVYHIDVYDFSHSGEGSQAGSPCEIWYSIWGGDLIYSANGALTYSHDPSNWDWPGYRFYQKRLNKNWFIMVSRYDGDNIYWRT